MPSNFGLRNVNFYGYESPSDILLSLLHLNETSADGCEVPARQYRPLHYAVRFISTICLIFDYIFSLCSEVNRNLKLERLIN